MSTDLMTRRGMRAEVAESWQRSAAAGVSTDRVDAPVILASDELRDLREAHPLAGSSRCSTTSSARRSATATR